MYAKSTGRWTGWWSGNNPLLWPQNHTPRHPNPPPHLNTWHSNFPVPHRRSLLWSTFPSTQPILPLPPLTQPCSPSPSIKLLHLQSPPWWGTFLPHGCAPPCTTMQPPEPSGLWAPPSKTKRWTGCGRAFSLAASSFWNTLCKTLVLKVFPPNPFLQTCF